MTFDGWFALDYHSGFGLGESKIPPNFFQFNSFCFCSINQLSIAKADGRYDALLRTIARADLLVLDDWGLSKLIKEHRHDLLEILEDRHGLRSTLVTSQMPVNNWHEIIADPTLADAILDRLVHNAYRLSLTGESMRKIKTKLT